MVELAGEHEFAAPRAVVWEVTLDPDVLARVVPGCEALTRTDEHAYQGRLRLTLGPVQGVFQGSVTLTDLEPHHGYRVRLHGRGPAGVIQGEGDIQLFDAAAGAGTVLRYTGQAQVSGRLATVGQRLMTSSAHAIARQSLLNLEQQVQARGEPVASGAAPGPAAPRRSAGQPPPPGQAAFMMGVARDVLADLLPHPALRLAVAAIALLLAVVGLGHWFANRVARRVVALLRAEEAR